LSRAPVLGFNNNVRHRGRLFHIQTEDSGIKFSRIVTHLFADGGRIIKTSRIDYVEHVEKDDVSNIVRALMKEQHRAMFTALRAGELDEILEKALGPLPEAPVAAAAPAPNIASAPQAAASPAVAVAPVLPVLPVSPISPASQRRRDSNRPASRPASDRPGRRRPITNPNLRGVAQSVPPPAADAFDLDVATLDRLPRAAARPPRKSNPPRKSRPPAAAAAAARVATAPQRPTTQLSNPPGTAARSIFGDGAVSEQTLDEVILSYLAEDLDPPGD
jgi:hypothetical protein